MAVISRDLGPVTAYAAAVNRGYTGTREEFETLMASYATVAEQAGESAESAEESADSAAQSAASASQSAQNAEGSKYNALLYSNQANGYKNTANTAAQAAKDARDAAQSAQTAAEAAQAGAEAAVDGFDSAVTQAISDVNAAGTNQKELAKRQAEKSEAWAVGQISGEDVGSSDPAYHNNAKYYAESVSASAQTASDAAQTATIKASEAQASASAAAESARTLAIDATLTQAGQAADAKKAGDKIDAVKEDIDYVSDKTGLVRSPNLTFTDGQSINDSNGNLNIRTYASYSDYIDCAGFSSVTLTMPKYTERQYIGLAFYDSEKTFVSGVRCNFDTELEANNSEVRTIDIPSTAAYFRTTWYASTETQYSTEYVCTLIKVSTITTKIEDIEGRIDLLGAETIEFTTGGYIATSGNVTSSVDFTPVASVGYRYAVVNCNAGDRFIINGKGAGSPRLWAFVDGANKMISHAEAGVIGNNLALVAPFNAKKLIINDNFVAYTTPQTSYALKSPNVSGIAFTPSYYIKTSGGIAEHTATPDGINFTKTSSFYFACAVIPCEAYDRIVLTGTGGSTTYLLWSFVDSNGGILKSSAASATLTDGVIAAPDGTAYCIINVDTRQPYSAVLSGSVDVFGGDVKFASGRIVTGSPNTQIDYTPVTDATFEYAIIDCVKGQHFTITATTENNSGKRLYCFVDLYGYVRERYNDTTSLVDADVVAPLSGKLVVNSLALYNHYVDTHYPYSPKNSLSVLPPNYLGALSYRALGTLSKGYICMMTDDGYDNGTIGLVQDTIPFAIAKDVPFTFALMRDSDVCKDQTKLAAVIDAVENHGCSVAQHGEFTWNGLSEEMLNTFFDLEKAFFDANGIEVKGAVIPAHYTTELIKAVCGGRFGVVRSGYSGIVPGTQDPAGTVTNYYRHYESGARSNLFCLSSYNCSGVSDAYNQQSVDYAYDNHTIMIVYFHENAMDSTKWQIVSNLVDYAKAKGLAFCTLGEIPYLL